MTLPRTLAAALVALALTPMAARAGNVWVAPATEKIRPSAAPADVTEARISAARNEFESFQVVITGPATKVSASATALGGPGTIDDVKLYREDLITLQNPSAVDGGTGPWPDALVPDVDDVVGEQRNAFPFDVKAGESRAIWVDVRVPPDAKPGTYTGSVKVTSGEGEATVPVTLQVWDFQLPSTASLRSAFGLSYGGIPSGHGSLAGDGGSVLRAQYAQLGLDHRISVTGMNDDGIGGVDHFDKYFGPLVDGTAPTRLPGAKLTAIKYVGDRNSVDEHKTWAKHAREKGWFDRLFDYTCDEPPLTCAWSDIAPRAKVVHDADPEFRTLVTTQIQDAQQHGVDDDIDLMVPVINWIDDKPGSDKAGDQRPKYDGFLASGKTKELWLYQSCMSHGCGGTVNIGSPSESDKYFEGWPTYVIDAAASRNRAMEWMSFLKDATGELYWETAYAFSHDAWSNQWDFSGNGDGTLFYPGTPKRIGGTTDIPVASIRLKMIREGMEDYEYLKLVADAGERDFARQVASELFPESWTTDVDPAAIMAAREKLAAKVLSLQGKKAPAPVSDGATSPASGGAATDGATGGATGGAAGAQSSGGGCSSGGGLGLAGLLGVPALFLLRRRRAAAAVRVRVRK